MAFRGNSFAALEDEDGDDVEHILARTRASAAKAEQKPSAVEEPPEKFSSNNPRSSSGHAGKGREQGNGSKRHNGKGVVESYNPQKNSSYQLNNGGFKRNNGHNVHGNGSNRNTGLANGYQKDENQKHRNGWQNTEIAGERKVEGKSYEAKELQKCGDTNAGAEWVDDVVAEATNGKHDQVLSQEEAERLAEKELEAKKLTLKEYEKQFEEKRKALEFLKAEERKVSPDKDFDSMHIVGKKNEENISRKMKSDSGKLKKKVTVDNNNNNAHKALATNFKLPSPTNSKRHDRIHPFREENKSLVHPGGEERGIYKSSYLERVKNMNEAPIIEDTNQFPSLGESQ